MKNGTGIILVFLLVLVISGIAYFSLSKTQTTKAAGGAKAPASGNGTTETPGQSPFSVLQGLLAQGQAQAPATTDQFTVDQNSSDQAMLNAYASGDTTDLAAAAAAQQQIALSFV